MSEANEEVIGVEGLGRRYTTGHNTGREALKDVSFRVDSGEFVAVLGHSGCGKSTLLGILGCLDRAYSGTLRLFGEDVAQHSDRQLAALRGARIGFVFQAFHLLGHLSARDNVLAPTLFQAAGDAAAQRERADLLMSQLGLEGRGDDSPSHMSGGERQRLAIARALMNEPELLLCDEPTGNLDEDTGAQIIDIFQRLHDDGMTIIAVTHEQRLARLAQRVIKLRQGELVAPTQAEET